MAAKLRLEATTTVATKLAMKPTAKAMLKARAEEYARLNAEVKEREARMDRIREETQDIFTREKQGKALLDGAEIDGIKFKLVCGSSSKFDKAGFMKEHGLGEADFEAFTERNPNTPYVKITVPRSK